MIYVLLGKLALRGAPQAEVSLLITGRASGVWLITGVASGVRGRT